MKPNVLPRNLMVWVTLQDPDRMLPYDQKHLMLTPPHPLLLSRCRPSPIQKIDPPFQPSVLREIPGHDPASIIQKQSPLFQIHATTNIYWIKCQILRTKIEGFPRKL